MDNRCIYRLINISFFSEDVQTVSDACSTSFNPWYSYCRMNKYAVPVLLITFFISVSEFISFPYVFV